MNPALSESQQRVLLTTGPRIAAAGAVTLVSAVQAVRGLLHPNLYESVWMHQLDFGLHGWVATVVKIGFYLALCWTAYGFIFRQKRWERWERLFFIGWVVDFPFLLLGAFGPTGAFAERVIALVGLLISLLSLPFLFATREPQTPE